MSACHMWKQPLQSRRLVERQEGGDRGCGAEGNGARAADAQVRWIAMAGDGQAQAPKGQEGIKSWELIQGARSG